MSLLPKKQTVKPGSSACVQDMPKATIHCRAIDGSEFRRVAEKVTDWEGTPLPVVPVDDQLCGGVAFEVGEQRLPERIQSQGVHSDAPF